MELLEMLLTGVGDILAEWLGVFCGWRFFLCIAAGILAIAVIYTSFESHKLSLALAIPTGVLFFAAGLIWDVRNG